MQYTTVVALLALLLVASGFAVWNRQNTTWRCLFVLWGNYIACNAAVLATGKPDPVTWFLLADFVSAVIILLPPHTRAQALIGAVYCAQIGMHLVQWPGGAAAREYANILTVGGGLQICVLIWSMADGSGKMSRAGFGRRLADRAVAHGAVRMGRRDEGGA